MSIDQAYPLPEVPYGDLVGSSFGRITDLFAANDRADPRILPYALMPRSAATAVPSVKPSSKVTRGLRARLPETMGDGIWDFVQISDSLFLSLTDAVYTSSTELNLPFDDVVKMRVILEGEISINFSRDRIAAGPGIYLSLHPGGHDNSYHLVGGRHQRMVVLHCRRDFFDEMMADAGSPHSSMSSMLLGEEPMVRPLNSRFVSLISELLAPPFSGKLGEFHRDAKSMELFCLFQQFAGLSASVQSAASSTKDRAKIGAARQILLENLASPPTIAMLAREVGINTTKLKVLFNEIVGMPIFEFVQNERLKTAAHLVRSTNLPISEISLRTGYAHPSNFTAAYRRKFGVAPTADRRI